MASIRSAARSTTVSRVSLTDFRVGTFERFSVERAESELILERPNDAPETRFKLESRRLTGVRFGASAVKVRFADIPETFTELVMSLALSEDRDRVMFPDLSLDDGGLTKLPPWLKEQPAFTAEQCAGLVKQAGKFRSRAERLKIRGPLIENPIEIQRRINVLAAAPYIRLHTLAAPLEIDGPEGDVHRVGDHGLHVNSFGTVLFGEMIFTRNSRRFLLTRFAFGSHIAGDGGGGETRATGSERIRGQARAAVVLAITAGALTCAGIARRRSRRRSPAPGRHSRPAACARPSAWQRASPLPDSTPQSACASACWCWTPGWRRAVRLLRR